MSFGGATISTQCLNGLCRLCEIKRCDHDCHGKHDGMKQGDLFGIPNDEGAALRDEGIARADRNADTEWKKAADLSVRAVARRMTVFTTDDVWDELHLNHPDAHTHEPRALGAVMKRAMRDGLIIQTEQFVRSRRPQAHKAPIQVWGSAL